MFARIGPWIHANVANHAFFIVIPFFLQLVGLVLGVMITLQMLLFGVYKPKTSFT